MDDWCWSFIRVCSHFTLENRLLLDNVWTIDRLNRFSYLTLSMYHLFSDKSFSIWSRIEFNVRKRKMIHFSSFIFFLEWTSKSECYLWNESIEMRTKQKFSLQTMFTILRRIQWLVRKIHAQVDREIYIKKTHGTFKRERQGAAAGRQGERGREDVGDRKGIQAKKRREKIYRRERERKQVVRIHHHRIQFLKCSLRTKISLHYLSFKGKYQGHCTVSTYIHIYIYRLLSSCHWSSMKIGKKRMSYWFLNRWSFHTFYWMMIP